MKKAHQQISLDFGFEEPSLPEAGLPEDSPLANGTDKAAAEGISVDDDIVVAPAAVKAPATTKAPARLTITDETTVLTIRKKPGRKEKEKVWKSATNGKRGRKSLKEIAAEADLIEIPPDDILFTKQYYSIGDVGNMFRMNPSLIRTWSNEFEQLLQPRKNRKGDRFFRPEDVKTLHLIYHLIRVRKFTLEGAKEHLKMQQKKIQKQFEVIQALQQFRAFLLELKQNL
ncbi:MerR family transcriptional regulator [Flavihumibacter petaseus]|uniref:HTH merR-type domain-containing protein n=1 Tax=Flavihumibacter petaseus NBRC 106054 TaxID=1220578 RepID=A0A0E9MWB8_9BACT|nr:MerR family transcriptional regulator [Flavihumibacter petaseus]GAO41813.1 hypothetical protein FPE01S_01_08270 [Flavihumibacter petaseus NBRC 106054]